MKKSNFYSSKPIFWLKKGHFLLIFAFLFLMNNMQAQNWQTSTCGLQINKIWMQNSTTGWAVSFSGAILKYNGSTLESQNIGTTVGFEDIWGIDANNIWAVGSNGTILKYNGSTWTSQNSGTTEILFGIWGTDANNIWAVGSNGIILKYNGSTWTSQNSGTSNWFYSIWGADANSVWAVGSGGVIFKYDGNTWAGQYSNPTQSLQGIWGTDTNNIWVVGSNGIILKYNGSTWSNQSSGTTEYLNDVWGIDANNIWAVGAGGTIRKYNGDTWSIQSSGTTLPLIGVWGTDANNICAVGSSGTVLKYNGSTWIIQFTSNYTGLSQSFNGVWGADASNVWMVGANGTIRKYNGSGWSSQSSGTFESLNGVWGIDARNIWTVGANGTIRKYNGNSWNSQSSGTSQSLNGVWGIDANNIWAVGAGGTIRKYNGSGWSSQSSGTSESLNGVWGIDANNIWAVGANGTILKYNGSGWSSQSSGTSESLNGVWGIDANNIWAVGAGGTIRKYNGNTWSTQSSGTTQVLYSVWGSDVNNIWAVGAGGTILKYNGSVWALELTDFIRLDNRGIFGVGTTGFIASSFATVLTKSLNTCTSPGIVNTASSNSPICSGATLNLSVGSSGTAPLTYTWSGAGTITNGNTATPSVTGAATGNYVVTISNSCGTVTSTAAVTVNALPTTYAVTGGGSFCAGGSGVAIGLANSQNDVTYQLKNGANNVGSAIAGTTGSAISFGNQTAAGTYTVVATNTTGGCTAEMSGNATISIDALPNANAGTDVIVNCTTPTTTLTATGGVSYVWNNGVTQGSSVTPTVTTTYSVIVTGANGCTATDDVVVTVDKDAPLANAGTDVTVNCTTPSTTLTATGGVSYVWNNGVIQGGSVAPTVTTTYSVIVTGANGCAATDDVVVTADKNTPTLFNVSGSGTFCAGDNGLAVQLSGSTNGISYQLQKDNSNSGSPVTGDGNALNFGLQVTSGTYTVIATNTTNGCTSTMSSAAIIIKDEILFNTASITDITVDCNNVIPSSSTPTVTNTCSTVSPTYSETSTKGNNISECNYYSYTITRIWTATDKQGNTATISQVITVRDKTAPVIAPLANITVTEGTIPTSVASSDNCSTTPVITFTETKVNNTPPACKNYSYVLTRTWIATDVCGNSGTRTQLIKAEGIRITCPSDKTINTNADGVNNYNCSTLVSAAMGVAPAFTDGCDVSVLRYTMTGATTGTGNGSVAGLAFNEGITKVTYALQSALTDVCSFNVTTKDVETPRFGTIANAILDVCDLPNPITMTTPSTSDNCSGVISVTPSIDVTATVSSCSSKVETLKYTKSVTRTWTATDLSGNTSTKTQTMYLRDMLPPTAICKDITVNIGVANVSVLATQINNNSNDNCTAAAALSYAICRNISGVCSFSSSISLTASLIPTGVNFVNLPVTLRVTDVCGNANTCNATIRLQKLGTLINGKTITDLSTQSDSPAEIGTSIPAIPSNIDATHGSLKCFPNPFSDNLNLEYNLTHEVSKVTLKVYDNQGRLMTKSEQGEQLAGYYQVNWNLSDLPAAMYHICLEIDGKCMKMERVIMMR